MKSRWSLLFHNLLFLKFVAALPSLRLRLSQKSKSNGAPTLLYIAGAALRVADVTRVLKNKKLQGDKGGDVAKLFAKHFKLAQHVTYLKRTKIGAAVGTPGRLGKLLNETGNASPIYIPFDLHNYIPPS